jgi:hypothetical protein
LHVEASARTRFLIDELGYSQVEQRKHPHVTSSTSHSVRPRV